MAGYETGTFENTYEHVNGDWRLKEKYVTRLRLEPKPTPPEWLEYPGGNGVEKAWSNEYVDHPKHYTKVPGIECIDVTKHFNFNKGNAIKYIWRAGDKDNEVQDLEKAKKYIDFEIERVKALAQARKDYPYESGVPGRY